MVTVRGIKPRGKAIDARKIMAGVRRGYELVAARVLHDYQMTTRTWSHRPKFVVRVKKDGFTLRTDDAIFAYVDRGTRPHRIVPRRAKVLRFGVPSRAKTVPGIIGSGAGGVGDTTVFSRGVDHPGTKARRFSEAIQEKWSRLAPTVIQDEMNKAVRG